MLTTTAPANGGVLQTEFEFTLPCGYVDGEGTLHRTGVMRRARASDEIVPMRDPRVSKNPAYLVVILLSRVVTRLGDIEQVTPHEIENLFATDLAFLQELYNRVNALEPEKTHVECPHCRQQFAVEEGDRAGGSSATPSNSSARR